MVFFFFGFLKKRGGIKDQLEVVRTKKKNYLCDHFSNYPFPLSILFRHSLSAVFQRRIRKKKIPKHKHQLTFPSVLSPWTRVVQRENKSGPIWQVSSFLITFLRCRLQAASLSRIKLPAISLLKNSPSSPLFVFDFQFQRFPSKR